MQQVAPPPWHTSLARLCRKFFDSWQGMPLCELESSGIAVHVRYCGVQLIMYLNIEFWNVYLKSIIFRLKPLKKYFFIFGLKTLKRDFYIGKNH